MAETEATTGRHNMATTPVAILQAWALRTAVRDQASWQQHVKKIIDTMAGSKRNKPLRGIG